ncbi:hypothetical protein [Streptomyces lydicus]|uniref:hypothetical protein n=1 Tax=Streptomyces lydicus TaxID=47763 RepID=UPI002989B76D|nr:hypothetical protein [Streptomyces lydicus]
MEDLDGHPGHQPFRRNRTPEFNPIPPTAELIKDVRDRPSRIGTRTGCDGRPGPKRIGVLLDQRHPGFPFRPSLVIRMRSDLTSVFPVQKAGLAEEPSVCQSIESEQETRVTGSRQGHPTAE